MRKHFLTCILVLSLVLAITMLAGCDLLDSFLDKSWKPSGESITLFKKSQTPAFVVVCGTPTSTSYDAADAFKNAINDSKIATINSIFSADTVSEANEVIFGSSDRVASLKAEALYKEKKSGLYSWVFYYYEGKLAIYAEDSTSYELALDDFLTRFASDNAITVKDTLAECVNMTDDEYFAYLEAEERVLVEERRKENATKISALLTKIEEQRTTISTNSLFDINNATADMAKAAGSNWGTPTKNPIDEHPRVMFNKSDISGIRKGLIEKTATNEYFFTLLDADYTGVLASPGAYTEGKNCHNYKGTDLEYILVKALAYQVYEDPYYGYQAIYAMKNYLNTMQFIYISSDQYRQFGDVGFTVACVYDWCYDLLTAEDKNQIIAGTENIIFKGNNEKGVKFEIGFPPTKQGSFTGHGSEYQLLRDYLSFAIAIYNENPTWYQYIGARFYNDFVPSRNYYFEATGLASQGTNYLSLRHIANFYSAWLATAGMGENPYNNLLETMHSFAAYEYAPGYIFTDGDGPTVQKTGNLRDAEFMAAYLYGDSTLLALAEKTLGSGRIEHATQGLGCAMYTIIRGKGTEPVEAPYENMDLIQYNGSPLGQYIIRESWNTTDSAAVFMKMKERHTANHEHGDSGSFQIYYKGMLSSEGGVYDNYNDDHTQKFYKSSISHNTLLIRNHKVYDEHYVGAQRTFSESATLNAWLANSSYDIGTITGQEHGYSDEAQSSPLYAYLAGDITKAYDSSTVVSYVGRRMLTVYTGNENFPMAFFVYDDISAKNTAFKKTFLLQITSMDKPEISKKKQTVTTENGDGRLVLTCLTDGVTIEGVGGRAYDSKGNYDPINSKNYLINGKQLPTLNHKDDQHWGRVEISISGAVKNTFMNVIYVTDKGQRKTAPTIKHIQNESVEGSTFGDVAAIFMTSRERVSSEVSFKVDSTGEMKYYVSGVAAGTWNISVNGKSYGTATATDNGGLLVFTAPAGTVSISPAK